MLSIRLVDPNEDYPEFDYQVIHLLYTPGTTIPLGARLGEWIYVGRDYENKN